MAASAFPIFKTNFFIFRNQNLQNSVYYIATNNSAVITYSKRKGAQMITGLNKLQTKICIYAILAALAIAACGSYSSGGSSSNFPYDMRGTWESNDPSELSGSLIIGYDTIKILGYAQASAPSENPNQLPFKLFTKGAELSAYVMSNELYINDRGALQEGIPYTYYTTGTSSANKQEFLRFLFAGRQEILKKTAEYSFQ